MKAAIPLAAASPRRALDQPAHERPVRGPAAEAGALQRLSLCACLVASVAPSVAGRLEAAEGA